MVSKMRALLILPALLLAGCGSTNTATTTPAPITKAPTAPNSLGLYELHIEGKNGQFTSSVSRVGGGVGAQEISGLSFATTAVATNTDANGNKHYSAAITVTNGSGKAIASPLYVPVAVSGYTQNGTYFTNAKDQTGATTTDPSGITTEQAYYSSGGTVQTDPNATPYVNLGTANSPTDNNTVAASLFSVPSGTSVSSVSGSAWQAPTLASGSTQNVKFGFNIPTTNLTYSFNIIFGVFATPAVNHLVISQLYGAGGSSATAYNADYLEIFNPTNSAISTSGLSVQYAASTNANNFGIVHTLDTVTIQPGSYYLIQTLASAATGTSITPAPDTVFTTNTINLNITNGKIALVKGTAAVSSTAPTAAIDFVGYGSANASEGATPAPALSATTSLFRSSNGCADSNVNGTDFTAGNPAPRNASTATNLCQ